VENAMSWQDDRSMSPEQFAWTIKRLGLNKGQTARYLGMSMSSVQRYYDGDAKIPVPIVLLLRSLVFYNIAPVVPQWISTRRPVLHLPLAR
jgi:DNA-binding transcriptional regulator YiaG